MASHFLFIVFCFQHFFSYTFRILSAVRVFVHFHVRNGRETMTPKIFGHHTPYAYSYINARLAYRAPTTTERNHYQFKCMAAVSSAYNTRSSSDGGSVWHQRIIFACDRSSTKNENCINYGKHLSLIGLIIIDVCTNREKQETQGDGAKCANGKNKINK